MTATRGEASRPADRAVLPVTGIVVACAGLVLLTYVLCAHALIAYPWDWGPEEGLQLDYARRMLEDPGTLYHRSVSPFPSAYGPLLPLLMAPLVALPAPLAAARLMALAFTLLGAGAVATLLYRRAGPLWGLAGASLFLVPMDATFWYMLVRVDGPMLALWLWAAVPLLPRDLSRGADSLSTRRIVLGTTLLLAAVLVKQTAVLHGAPLVLGWFLVDRRSGWRLSAAVGLSGLACLGLLQLLSEGGYLWVSGLWGHHAWSSRLAWANIGGFVVRAWPVLALATAAGLLAWRARASPQREPSLLLVLGGLGVLPALGKHGAWWSYLLPLLAATVVLGGCWAARATRAVGESARLGAVRRLAPVAVASLCALVLASARTFPLPSSVDRATARAFYGLVVGLHDRAGGPLLVARPDLVYFLVAQPVEIEGSSFQSLIAADAPGVEGVLSRLREARYTVVVETWPIAQGREWKEALVGGYRHVGGCQMGWYFGSVMSHVLVRRDRRAAFAPPSGTRCVPAEPE